MLTTTVNSKFCTHSFVNSIELAGNVLRRRSRSLVAVALSAALSATFINFPTCHKSRRPAANRNHPARNWDRPARNRDRPARNRDRSARNRDRPARNRDEHCSELMEIFFRPAANRGRPAKNRDRPAANRNSSTDNISICSREFSISGKAVSISGRAVSISARAVSICSRVVLISGRAVSICSRSEIECIAENFASCRYLDALHLKVVLKKDLTQTDRHDKRGGSDSRDGHDRRT